MESKRIDALNIFLIVISLGLAVNIPFRLFLFSYSILGPIHYLTEINWLQEKNYFVKPSRQWIIVLYISAVLISLVPVAKFFNANFLPLFVDPFDNLSNKGNVFLLAAFLFSISLIFFRSTIYLIFSLLLSLIISSLLSFYIPSSVLVIGVFLPTILHVFLFTLLFMIYGAIKSKSVTGMYAAILLAMIPLLISQMKIKPVDYIISPETWDTFYSSNMAGVSAMTAKILGCLKDNKFNAMSVAGIKIQIFISFAYTYHYLNWFSKTSIIGWQKAMTRNKTKLILFIWFSALAIYAYDFKTGFMALFFLSFLHVLLEFPLNIITIRELFLLPRSESQ